MEIIKFKNFTMLNELYKDGDSVIAYLYALKNDDINEYVNGLITAPSRDKKLKKEYIEDILLEIGAKVEPMDFKWIDSELKKYITNDKRKY